MLLSLAACASEPAATSAAAPAPAPAAAEAPAPDAGARQPVAPYWSLQLATATGKAKALEALKPIADTPYARAEKRKSGWQVRAGAWATREDAEGQLPAYREKFGKNVGVLQLQNPVDWLLPSGEMLPVAVATAAVAVPAEPVATTGADPAMREAAAKLETAVRAALKSGAERSDHYVYADDVAPLLLYAAQRKDQPLYESLLPAVQKLVLDSKDDPYARGFVLARAKAGGRPERSDAGAMALMARALWTGADAFKRDDDRASALMILDGYARHAYETQGAWLVRHAFDFSSRTFSSSSFITDYQGDFLAQAEREAGRSEWRGYGARSQALVAQAAGAAHLLRPLVQPEIAATWPGAGTGTAIAPNNLTPLEDSCLAAQAVGSSNADLARGVLAFATAQAGHGGLKAFYNVDTGDNGGEGSLPVSGIACLEALAGAMNDGHATKVLDSRFIAVLRAARGGDLSTAGALLLAAQARGAL